MSAEAAEYAAALDELEADPVVFAQDALGIDPWQTQRAILQALTRPQARVAVKACHSSGKTHVAASAVLWWLASGGKAITTAPTWTQVTKLLWGEIHKMHGAAPVNLGGKLNETELKLGPDCYALGLSTNEGVRFQGHHGRVLIVIDEAPGVRPDIWEAIEGIRAGGDVRVLALGNPTIPSGPFYDAFTRDLAHWQTFTISAFDTPNLEGLDEAKLLELDSEQLSKAARDYLTTRRWVREKLEQWGKQSPLYQARVLGSFPEQAEDSLYWLSWLERARLNEAKPKKDGKCAAGIDVAGPGEDETSLHVHSEAEGDAGRVVELSQHWRQPDARGEVLAALRPFRARLETVNVDEAGLGYYFVRHLKDEGLPVRGINVGSAPKDKQRFANLKAELYWTFREWLRDDWVAGLTDETTIAQLASVKYGTDSKGRVIIESKDDAKKRGVRSPDRAESLILSAAPKLVRQLVWAT